MPTLRTKIILGLSGLIFICCILLIYIKWQKGQLPFFSVTFFNVGQADSALIRFADGEKMLVDCGADSRVLAKLGRALPFYDRTIDYLLITHFDNDHYGGCAGVLERYRVRNIIDNGDRKDGDRYFQAYDAARQTEGALEEKINGARVLDIGGARLEFFSPDPAFVLKKNDSNNQSVIFRLTNVSSTFFFAGDAEEPLENFLVSHYCSATSTCPALRSDVLKVGHHGSDSSSSEDFLSAIAPRDAIISVGKNTFGHPSLRVLRKLGRAGAIVWRTDEFGDIIKR